MKTIVLKDITKNTVELPLIFLRRKAVEQMTGLSKSSLYQQIQLGEFPAPVQLTKTGMAVAWLNTEVNLWMQSRIQQRK
ncbi:helix-turn-helix transcriptional regulator [Collimonas sp. NPDC087041]|uniref:helix-turn-helix transcriptional regulator n=1 Tax=Collimonas sp. NPDC087041 TaxID=3363960 RepID=UPI003808D580